MSYLFQWLITIVYVLLLILPIIYLATGLRLLKIGMKELNTAKKKSAEITIVVSAGDATIIGILWFTTMGLFAFSSENFQFIPD